MRSAVCALLVALCLTGAAVRAGEPAAIRKMQVEVATADKQGKTTYVPAPDALRPMKAEEGEDDEGPKKWHRVSLPDPAPLKPWCQHAGLILTLEKPIPAGKPFRVRGLARSVSGARGLSVLRRWGGSKPWTHVPLTKAWQPFTVRRVAADHETRFITISMVAKPKRRLQPCAKGVFDIADLVVERVEENAVEDEAK
jgi:hypothetical protein